jgi:hypothetical protein
VQILSEKINACSQPLFVLPAERHFGSKSRCIAAANDEQRQTEQLAQRVK